MNSKTVSQIQDLLELMFQKSEYPEEEKQEYIEQLVASGMNVSYDKSASTPHMQKSSMQSPDNFTHKH
jgi:hypothetical protein